MELISLCIKSTINTSRYGALSAGDRLRTDSAYARHLVDDLHVAEYDPAEQPTPPPENKPRRRYKKRQHP